MMDNLKRRDFMKLVGIAAIAPMTLLKAKQQLTHPVDVLLDLGLPNNKFMKEMRLYCDEPVYKTEPFSLDTYELEVDIEYPSVIYDDETGKSREINFANPADIAIFNLYSPDIKALVDWIDFEDWSKYCDKANLKIKNYSPLEYKTLLELLVYVSNQGSAFIYWDGKDKGILKVIYGLPEYLENQANKLGFNGDIKDEA